MGALGDSENVQQSSSRDSESIVHSALGDLSQSFDKKVENTFQQFEKAQSSYAAAHEQVIASELHLADAQYELAHQDVQQSEQTLDQLLHDVQKNELYRTDAQYELVNNDVQQNEHGLDERVHYGEQQLDDNQQYAYQAREADNYVRQKHEEYFHHHQT